MWKKAVAAVGLALGVMGIMFACSQVPYSDYLPLSATEAPSAARGLGYAPGAGPAGAAAAAAREEIWVIQKPLDVSPTPQKQAPQQRPAELGTGTLVTKVEEKNVPLPLKHTDVKASITGYIAATRVRQQFHNPYGEKIEAVYVFPLPENAAVNEFVMNIGERKIRGLVRERQEARKTYEDAKRAGYVASLLTQERPNIFTQNVANIEPGKQIDIDITYYNTLTYRDGNYEYVFPMVVGPRYNPAGFSDGVGAAARGARGASGQKTEVQYLAPHERSGHDISLEVAINGGATESGEKLVEKVDSVNHQIRRKNGENSTIIQLDPADAIPNKDFVLRYRVAGETAKTAMFVQPDADGKGGYFTLMLVPPAELGKLARRGVEMVFVIDTSGSMDGMPISQAKKATQTAIALMQPNDTLQVVRFAGDASQMTATPLAATPANRAKANAFVQNLSSGGGTEMLKGINAALDFPHDENRTRVVTFLTDGYIGNEAQILTTLHAKLADSRVFSFGVGSSVNRYLLDSMATIGNGAVAYLSLNEKAEPVMSAYMDRISHPAFTNIKLAAEGIKISNVYPSRIPDLFVGTPVYVSGRYEGQNHGEIHVTGIAGDREMTVKIALDKTSVAEHKAVEPVWARMKISDLADHSIRTGKDMSQEIRDVAIQHSLMSQYTSFVAVDESRKTEGDHGTTVVVPVPMPEGVKYENTVIEKNKPATSEDHAGARED